jgi:glyoxylase-like metal-dependent hydrolase (beta-lactamase superfamily II)
MAILRYELGPMGNNTYLVIDETTQEAALIDPSFESEAIWPDIEANGCTLRYVLNTHAHFDHILGNAFWVEKTGALLGTPRAELDLLRALPEQGKRFNVEVTPSPEPNLFLEDGQTLTLGETQIRVLGTPGHSPGGVTFVVDDAAIVGDALFSRSVGRTDLPGASLETLMHSIRTRLLTLPDETRVLPGHGRLTTIGTERRENPYLQGE